MLLTDEIVEICTSVQSSTISHQKNRQRLIGLYNKQPNDEFVRLFKQCLRKALCATTPKESYMLRLLDFCASFVVQVCGENKPIQSESNVSEEENTHPFLTEIFDVALELHDSSFPEIRYHSCLLVTSLLKHLGESFLDSDICDKIENAMLQRISDFKSSIRCQAVIALARLQDPANPDCPIIRAFLLAFGDPNHKVRKHVVQVIAITAQTISKILEVLHDVDTSVRIAAYERCIIIGPKFLKIEQRQTVIYSGFKDENKRLKSIFINKLLPKWLSCYNGDYLQLLKAVKLDAYETDYEMTEFLNTNVLKEYFKVNPINEIISYLPISEEKTVPLDKLTTEVVIFWRVLIDFLKNNVEDFVDQVTPEVPTFCDYIYSYHKEKRETVLEVWDFYEYQTILANLLMILSDYDFSDEACRVKVKHLVEKLVSYSKCSQRVLDDLLKLYVKLVPNLDELTNEIALIISNIREPLVEEEMSEEQVRDKDFTISQLKYKIHVLMEDQSNAVKKQDFEGAALIKSEITSLKQQIEEIESNFSEKIKRTKTPRNEIDVTYHVLNILISLFKLPQVKCVTTAIRSLKTEFIVPLLSNNDPEIYSKIIECLGLCCLLDLNWAQEHLRPILTPMINYRIISTVSKELVLTSMKFVFDFALLYGAKLFIQDAEMEETQSDKTVNGSMAVRKQANKSRKLYTFNETEDLGFSINKRINLEELVEIALDLFDDDHDDIRLCASHGLCNLLRAGLINSSSIIARLFLKWISPVVEKNEIKIQQMLGYSLLHYAQFGRGCNEVLVEAVVPVLSSIANAPCTSPLVDVDIGYAMESLLAFLSLPKSDTIVNNHLHLARLLCRKIQKRPQDAAVPLFTKMLLYLKPSLEDCVVIQELVQQVDQLLEDIEDKAPNRNLKKFKHSLSGVDKTGTTSIQEPLLTSIPETSEDDETAVDKTQEEQAKESPPKNASQDNKENKESEDVQNLDNLIQNGSEFVVNCKRKSVEKDSQTSETSSEENNQNREAVKRSKRGKVDTVNNGQNQRILRDKNKTTGNKNDLNKKETNKHKNTGNNGQRKSNRINEKDILKRANTDSSEISGFSTRTRSSGRISNSPSTPSEITTTNDSVKRKKDRVRKVNGTNNSFGEETILKTVIYNDSNQLEYTIFSDDELARPEPDVIPMDRTGVVFSDEEASIIDSTSSQSSGLTSVSSTRTRQAKVVLTETSTDSESPQNLRRTKRIKKTKKRF